MVPHLLCRTARNRLRSGGEKKKPRYTKIKWLGIPHRVDRHRTNNNLSRTHGIVLRKFLRWQMIFALEGKAERSH